MRFGLWQVLAMSAAAGVVWATVATAGATKPSASKKEKVLIVTGQNRHHRWQETTPAIKAMLEKTGRFTVDVVTTPPPKSDQAAWASFKPDFAAHDVVLLNYYGEDWPTDVFKAFVKFVANGGGLVVYHSSVAPFEDSNAFNEMIGMGWRKADFGKRLTIDKAGKQVVTPKGEGPGAGHGPAHPYEIVIRDADHPVTKGLPKKFMHMKDELYHGMRGPLTNVHVLATAWSDPNFKGTGTNEPMVWTGRYGKGRVFVDLLGHEGVNTTTPSSAVFIERGLQWAAIGKVTLPAPKGLGTEK